MKHTKYDKLILASFVAESFSYAEVVRKFGKKPVGGTITNMKLMCRRFNIDTSHMTGQGHMKGIRSNKRTHHLDRLILGTPNDHRISHSRLKRSLEDIGRKYCCVECDNEGVWRGKKMTLEIDHIDGQYWNNTPKNLRYVCPNCHSTKD